MAMTLYKPGQGYWTRLMSGIGGGVLALALAIWLADQFTLITALRDYQVYVRLIVITVVMGLTGYFIYRWVAVKPAACDFLIATEGEMKKVNWPTRKEVIGSTWVVIACVALLTILLFTTDFLFSLLFRSIGILQV